MRAHLLKPILSWAVFLAWYLCFAATWRAPSSQQVSGPCRWRLTECVACTAATWAI